MHQMGMTPAVSGALREAQMCLLRQVVNALGREPLDRLGQELCVVRHFDFPRYLRLSQLRRVQHVRLMFDQSPLKRPFRPVNVDALAVLPRGVEQRPDNPRRQVGVFEFDVGRLDGKRRAVILDEFLADGAGAEAGDIFGGRSGEREHRPDTVRRIPHRRQSRPVVGPAVHVLLMARLQELYLSEIAFFVELLDVKKLAAIDHGFHHDVILFRLPHEVHDFLAVLNAGRHRHGAGDVFAGLERRNRLPGVIGNGGVDVDGVDVRVLEQLVEIVVPVLHAKRVADRIQFCAGALADGVHVGARMPLVDGNKLGAEAQPDYGDVNFSLAHALRIDVTSDGPHNSSFEG